MPIQHPLRSQKLRNRTSWAVLLFGVAVLLSVGVFAASEHLNQLFVFLAAVAGSTTGLLYSTLDHDFFTLKPHAVIESNLMQNAYIALRVSIPTAIGYGASYITLFGPDASLPQQLALAFAAAYIADVSKLILK